MSEQVRPGRECKGCGESRRAEMVNQADSLDGHRMTCKACVRDRAAAWREANRDRHRAYSRAWAAAHPPSPEARARRAKNTREWRAANPDKYRGYPLRKYGLSVAEFDEMLARQGGACGVCGVVPGPGDRRLAVDHDHACCPGSGSCGRCVRGLLCASCNTALGHFQDSPDILRAAARYIDDHAGGSA